MMNSKTKVLFQLYSNSGWFKLPKTFFHMTPSIEAAVALAYLINRVNVKIEKEDEKFFDNDGWFRLPAKTIQGYFNVSEYVQTKIVRDLIECGFIQTEMRGMPRRRWVFINIEAIQDAMANTKIKKLTVPKKLGNVVPKKLGDCDPKNHSSMKNPLEEPEKEELSQPTDGTPTHLSGSSTNGKSESKNKPSSFDRRCAVELQKATIQKGKGNKTSKIYDWSNQFRLLRERDGKAQKLIKKVLLWYMDQDWTETYMPQAFSAKTFRDKFNEKLFPAYERANQNGQSSEPKLKLRNKEITAFGLQTRYHKKFGSYAPWRQEDMDVILTDLGEKPGSVKVEDL